MKKINFNWITAGYLVFLGLILLSTTSREPDQPKQMLILKFDDYRDLKFQSEHLFKKGWRVKHTESYLEGSRYDSDFLVIYEK